MSKINAAHVAGGSKTRLQDINPFTASLKRKKTHKSAASVTETPPSKRQDKKKEATSTKKRKQPTTKTSSKSKPKIVKVKDFYSLNTEVVFRKGYTCEGLVTLCGMKKLDRPMVPPGSTTGNARTLGAVLSAKETESISEFEFFSNGFVGADNYNNELIRNTFQASGDNEARVLPIGFIRKPALYGMFISGDEPLIENGKQKLDDIIEDVASIAGLLPVDKHKEDLVRYAWANPKVCFSYAQITEGGMSFTNSKGHVVCMDSRMLAHFFQKHLIGSKKLDVEEQPAKRKRSSSGVTSLPKKNRSKGPPSSIRKVSRRHTAEVKNVKRHIAAMTLDLYAVTSVDENDPKRTLMCNTILNMLQVGNSRPRYTYRHFKDSIASETLASFRCPPTKQKGGRKALPKLKSIEEENNEEAAAIIARSSQLVTVCNTDTVTRFEKRNPNTLKAIACAKHICSTHHSHNSKPPVISKEWLWKAHIPPALLPSPPKKTAEKKKRKKPEPSTVVTSPVKKESSKRSKPKPQPKKKKAEEHISITPPSKKRSKPKPQPQKKKVEEHISITPPTKKPSKPKPQKKKPVSVSKAKNPQIEEMKKRVETRKKQIAKESCPEKFLGDASFIDTSVFDSYTHARSIIYHLIGSRKWNENRDYIYRTIYEPALGEALTDHSDYAEKCRTVMSSRAYEFVKLDENLSNQDARKAIGQLFCFIVAKTVSGRKSIPNKKPMTDAQIESVSKVLKNTFWKTVLNTPDDAPPCIADAVEDDFDMFGGMDENTPIKEEVSPKIEGVCTWPNSTKWLPLISDENNATSTMFLRHIFPAILDCLKEIKPKNYEKMFEIADASNVGRCLSLDDLFSNDVLKMSRRLFWLYIMTLEILVEPSVRGVERVVRNADFVAEYGPPDLFESL